MRVIFLFMFAVVLAPGAAAQPAASKGPSWQLLSGQDYLELAEYDREVYVTGLNDAYNWSYVAGFERMKWLVPCVLGRKAPQLAAMYAKWLQAKPERWHEPAAKLFPFAMFESCRKPNKKPAKSPVRTPPKSPSK
jgi:hypothetical protein